MDSQRCNDRPYVRPKVYYTSWIEILTIVVPLGGFVVLAHHWVANDDSFEKALAWWTFCLAMVGAFLFWLVYALKFSLTLKSDRLVIGAFNKREILYSEIVSVNTWMYKATKGATFTLRDGKEFSIDSGMGGYKEALELLKGSMS